MIQFAIIAGIIVICIVGYLWYSGKLLDKAKVYKDKDDEYKLK